MIRRITAPAAAMLIALTSLPALAFGPQEFGAGAIEIDDIIGRLDVTVDSNARAVTVAVTGPERRLREVTVRQEGNKVVIDQEHTRGNYDEDDWVSVRITAPPGTALKIDDFIGEGKVGDLAGPVDIASVTSGKLTIGHVTTANIHVNGSGDVAVGTIDNGLTIGISGSGTVKTGTTRGPVSLEISGSGDIDIASVDGPLSTEINGSGNVALRGGRADPFAVNISGSGDVLMEGTVKNQSIRQSGSGQVQVKGGGA